MPRKIKNTCIKCGACAAICPVEAISEGEKQYIIDPEICIDCGACQAECPTDSIIEDN